MIHGACVQVSSGGPNPTADQANAFHLDTVRDVFGWHKIEHTRGNYTLPVALSALGIAASVVSTLAFGNKDAGYTPTNMSVPDTDEAREGFARYASWVVQNVPNLSAVCIGNEYNGSFDSGSPPTRFVRYAKLLEATVPAIRAANPKVKIIAGATVGWNIQGWFTHLNILFPLSQIDYLDIHPYLGADHIPDFRRQMDHIRGVGITNPAWYSEHGGPVAMRDRAGYPGLFAEICKADVISPAGENIFLLQSGGKFHSGLLDEHGAETPLGTAWRGLHA